MDFIARNLFTKLRAENFGTNEAAEPMTNFKKNKLKEYVKNIDSLPPGKVVLANPMLNKKLIAIQNEETQSATASPQTIYLLRIIVINVNTMLNGGISLRGIIQLGIFLRSRGEKVDYTKLNTWLEKLRLRRMAQLQGSILMKFFNFTADELPFVRHYEGRAKKLTLKSLSYNYSGEKMKFGESSSGLFVKASNGAFRKSLMRTLRFLEFAPVEVVSNFLNNFAHSISEIEE